MGVPALFAWAGSLAESVGGLLVLTGLLTRLGAALAVTQMSTAAILGGHVAHGFFANWFRATVDAGGGKLVAAPEGFEFHVAMVAMALALVILAGGRWSADRLLVRETTPRIRKV